MKSSFQISPDELGEIVASVLATNGHEASGPILFFANGQPVEVDQVRVDVAASLKVRCAPEQSQYDKMLARYQDLMSGYSQPVGSSDAEGDQGGA